MDETTSINWIDAETGNHDGGVAYGPGFCVSWQRGPTTEGGGERNGAYLLDVLEVCKTQLTHYQSGQFACDENVKALAYLQETICALEERLERRQAEGKLGTHEA
ncbi:MAG: hypothetical protein AAFO83_00935 [Cyanobacteria bacterium J06607_13]